MTDQEREVIRLIREGGTIVEVAPRLGLTRHRVTVIVDAYEKATGEKIKRSHGGKRNGDGTSNWDARRARGECGRCGGVPRSGQSLCEACCQRQAKARTRHRRGEPARVEYVATEARKRELAAELASMVAAGPCRCGLRGAHECMRGADYMAGDRGGDHFPGGKSGGRKGQRIA